jgi:hypothetical protein
MQDQNGFSSYQKAGSSRLEKTLPIYAKLGDGGVEIEGMPGGECDALANVKSEMI